MVVTRRQNFPNNNVEEVKQTQKANGLSTGQVQSLDRSPEGKSIGQKISSVAKKYFKFLSYTVECLVCAVAIFCLVLFLSPLLIVYNVLKFIEKQWVYFKSGSVAMSGQDTLWLQDTKENRLIINSALVLECTNIEHSVKSVQDVLLRCMALKNDKGQLLYPRFSKCIQRGVFQYFLKQADNLDIDQHIYAYQGQVPKSHEEMETLMSTLVCEDIPFDKPPWRFIIIPKTYDSNEAIVLFRLHHGFADGVSITKFLLEHFPDDKLPENKLIKFSSVDRKWMLLNALLSGARILIKKIFSAPDSSIIHGHPLIGVKKISWSKQISLDVVKNIKNATGTTVNDILMSCVSMSFHDYFSTHGDTNHHHVTASVPVDVRPKGSPLELENNFAVVSLKLPVDKKDVLENLYATKAHMDEVKHSGEAFVVAIGGNMSVEYMPQSVTCVWNVPIANKHSLVLSNVPGPQQPFCVGGHKVTSMFFAPPQRNLIGIGVGLYSYAGTFSIGVQSDLNCMTDPEFIVNAFESRLAQLEKCVASGNGQIRFDSGIE